MSADLVRRECHERSRSQVHLAPSLPCFFKSAAKHLAASVVRDGRSLHQSRDRIASRKVRLELKTETSPRAISTKPSQFAVRPRSSSAASAIGKARGEAGATETATASLAAGAAAR